MSALSQVLLGVTHAGKNSKTVPQVPEGIKINIRFSKMVFIKTTLKYSQILYGVYKYRVKRGTTANEL